MKMSIMEDSVGGDNVERMKAGRRASVGTGEKMLTTQVEEKDRDKQQKERPSRQFSSTK